MATIGAITSALGMNLIKASSKLEKHKPIYKRYRWLAGMALACWMNTFLDVIAFALAPLTVIAPIGGVTIVASVVFARIGIVGTYEFVSWSQWVAILVVVIGVAVVDVFGPHPEPVLNTNAVLDRFHEEGFVLYQLTVALAVMVTYTGLYIGKLGDTSLETTIFTAVSGGLCSGVTQTMLKVLATCGGAWMLNGTYPFERAEFWFAIVELITVALVLFHMLTLCLQSANLALSAPMYQINVILFTIVAGCAYYGDLDVATRSELLMFLIGVMCVIGGLGVLIAIREIPHQRLIPSQDGGGGGISAANDTLGYDVRNDDALDPVADVQDIGDEARTRMDGGHADADSKNAPCKAPPNQAANVVHRNVEEDEVPQHRIESHLRAEGHARG